YTVEYYREMLARCRERVPGVSISSDFIVGFSRESEQSFQRSCDLVAEAGFKNSYIFKYSPRPGTKGFELYPDDVPEEIKKRRNNDLLAIQNKVSLADHVARIGQVVEVLVEGPSKTFLKSAGAQAADRTELPQLTGRSSTNRPPVMHIDEIHHYLESQQESRPLFQEWSLRDPERGFQNLTRLAQAIGAERLRELSQPLGRLLPRSPDPDMALNSLERF